jgi:hypothetical protein
MSSIAVASCEMFLDMGFEGARGVQCRDAALHGL